MTEGQTKDSSESIVNNDEDDDVDKEYKGIVSSFPNEVKPRFIALKTVANKREKLQKKLDREIGLLYRKYEELFKPWDKQRDELINGERDPNAEELIYSKGYTTPTEEKRELKLDVDELKNTKGFPAFWLKAMKNVIELSSHIKDYDEPILKSLIGISRESINADDYKLIFRFAPNEHFTNTELTKTMLMEEDDPNTCKRSVGTNINWCEGKNVTVKVVKKKQKSKNTKAVIEKITTVKAYSFFNFFKSRTAPEDNASDLNAAKMTEEFASDVDIADAISEHLIPNALYYYMGLIIPLEAGEVYDEDMDWPSGDDKPKHRKASTEPDGGAAKSKKECKQQ